MQFAFVTGPPRSGTTYISDWLTQAAGVYCVHEVLAELAGATDEKILAHLMACAATGSDRLGKPRQREFLNWDSVPTRRKPQVLGLKEPCVWPIEPDRIPYPVGGYFDQRPTRYVVMIRHPYDVIASGHVRAATTRNWPGFSAAQLCDFWSSALTLADRYRSCARPLLVIRWEEMLLDPGRTKTELEAFFRVSLPAFGGSERSQEYLDELRRTVDLRGGVVNGPHRSRLTDEDRETARGRLAGACRELGYDL